MQRIAVLALCAAAAAATVWLLLRSGERLPAGASATGAAVERPANAPDAGATNEPGFGSRAPGGTPSGASPGGASAAAGNVADGAADAAARAASVADGGAPGANAGASDSRGETAGTDAVDAPDAPVPPPGVGEASAGEGQSPSLLGGDAPAEAEPDVGAKDPTPDDPKAGERLTMEQARKRAERAFPDDGRLTREQREPILDDLAKQIYVDSGKAGNLQGPVYVEPTPPPAP